MDDQQQSEEQSLPSRVASLEYDVAYLKRQLKNQSVALDMNSLMSIAFLALFFLVVVSIKVSYGGIEYDVNLNELGSLLSVPAVGAAFAGLGAWAMKKYERDQM